MTPTAEGPAPERNVEQEFDALKNDVKKLGDDFANLARALLDTASPDNILAKLRELADRGSDEVGAAASALGKQGNDAIVSVGRQVRERPLTTILICLGLGFVIGKLIDR
jgi:ElaB/YqjD/DUF883 family membrane-anchored ribosome-binding protein